MRYSVMAVGAICVWMTAGLIMGCPNSNETLWTYTFGQVNEEVGYAVVVAKDGSSVVAGWTNSSTLGSDAKDMCLVHAPSGSGAVDWYNVFGAEGDQVAYALGQTADDGFVLAGFTWPLGRNDTDVYMVKTNASGGDPWATVVGTVGDDCANAVQQTSDLGYILAGYTNPTGANSDMYLVKILANHEADWDQAFGGSRDDVAYAVEETTDHGFILAGYATVAGTPDHWDMCILKTDANGIKQWKRKFGGAYDDEARAIRQTPDGGYIVVGTTWSYGAGNGDVYVVKTKADGTQQWAKTYGGTGAEMGMSVELTSDGGYVIAGYTTSYGNGAADVYLIKTNSAGVVAWSNTFGGTSDDAGTGVAQADDGGYIVSGGTESYGIGSSDFYVVKTGKRGGGYDQPKF